MSKLKLCIIILISVFAVSCRKVEVDNFLSGTRWGTTENFVEFLGDDNAIVSYKKNAEGQYEQIDISSYRITDKIEATGSQIDFEKDIEYKDGENVVYLTAATFFRDKKTELRFLYSDKPGHIGSDFLYLNRVVYK